MRADRKKLKFLALSILVITLPATLTSCTIASSISTPRGWGTEAGKYGSSEWVKGHPGEYPTSESIATYCVSVAEQGQRKYNWTISAQMTSSDSCVSAFVKGLSK